MKKILIIDDNSLVLNWFQDVLEPLGHEIHSVEGAGCALDQFRETEFDLAFFDYNLGYGMDGWQLADHLLQHPEEFKAPKAVWIHTTSPVGALELQKRFNMAKIPCHVEPYDWLITSPKEDFKSAVEELLR